MHRGLIAWLRSCRRSIAQTLVLALLVPLLLGLLPQPGLSAGQALARDIAASICDPSGEQRGEHQPQGHHDSCILCTSGQCASTPSLAAASAAFTAFPQEAGPLPPAARIGIPALLEALIDGSPPRGPPRAA